MSFTNPAGKHHAKSLQLQRDYGENFLLTGAQNVGQRNSIGTDHSTFLGMREIQSGARVLDAQVAIMFREREVLATVAFQVDVVCKPADTVQQPPLQPLQSTIKTTKIQQVYIAVDDDK